VRLKADEMASLIRYKNKEKMKSKTE